MTRSRPPVDVLLGCILLIGALMLLSGGPPVKWGRVPKELGVMTVLFGSHFAAGALIGFRRAREPRRLLWATAPAVVLAAVLLGGNVFRGAAWRWAVFNFRLFLVPIACALAGGFFGGELRRDRRSALAGLCVYAAAFFVGALPVFATLDMPYEAVWEIDRVASGFLFAVAALLGGSLIGFFRLERPAQAWRAALPMAAALCLQTQFKKPVPLFALNVIFETAPAVVGAALGVAVRRRYAAYYGAFMIQHAALIIGGLLIYFADAAGLLVGLLGCALFAAGPFFAGFLVGRAEAGSSAAVLRSCATTLVIFAYFGFNPASKGKWCFMIVWLLVTAAGGWVGAAWGRLFPASGPTL